MHDSEWRHLIVDRDTAKVTMVVDEAKGSVSGGTIASMFGLFSEAPDVQRAISDPYCLDPPNSRYAYPGSRLLVFRRNPWTSRFDPDTLSMDRHIN